MGIIRPLLFFRLLAFSGSRKSELLALTWNDINFTRNEIRINKALARGKNSRLYIKTTKTKKIHSNNKDGCEYNDHLRRMEIKTKT